jgi:hypothetical protein
MVARFPQQQNECQPENPKIADKNQRIAAPPATCPL